ncbi:MAG: HDIG domain-containing protein [Akkermansia sp.]|nr:HDIG domain-containing protein [Akkermansia sp.]
MFNFFSLFRRSEDDGRAHSMRTGYVSELSVVILGLIVMGVMAFWMSADTMDGLYRQVRLLIAAVAVIILGFAFRLPAQLNFRRTLLLMVVIILQLFFTIAVNALCGNVPGYHTAGQALLWMPYLLAPTVVAVMIGRRLGIYAALCCTLFGYSVFPGETPTAVLFNYGAVCLLVGIVAARMSGRAHKRERILQTGFVVAAVVLLAIFGLTGLQDSSLEKEMQLGTFRNGFRFSAFAGEVGVTVALNFVLAAFIGGVIPALERIFNISTPITWLEWADMNHPLLKKLQIAAPGTFHHSLVVQRLSEAAAEAIGADVTRAGVCGLYHDIGKIENPQYFAENIVDQSVTPHADLTPEASARIITGHVTDGVELAEKYGLNIRIVNVIREHHGVSTAYFFYRKAQDLYQQELQKFEEGLIDTCPEEVDISVFTYKGPIPQTRESGIVSMADAVESATRSLQHPTEEDIRSMIDGIFRGRILDGHLQDCHLTLGDIAVMKETFFNTIRTMHHNRISYPKPKSDATLALADKRQAEKEKKAES